jgi:hypothetical protein
MWIQDLLPVQCLGQWSLQIVASLYTPHFDICFVQEEKMLLIVVLCVAVTCKQVWTSLLCSDVETLNFTIDGWQSLIGTESYCLLVKCVSFWKTITGNYTAQPFSMVLGLDVCCTKPNFLYILIQCDLCWSPILCEQGFYFSLVFVGFGGMLPIFLCIVYMSDFVSCDNIGYQSISIGHLPWTATKMDDWIA